MRVKQPKRIREMPTRDLQKKVLDAAYNALTTMGRENISGFVMQRETASLIVEVVERFMTCEMDLNHSDAIIDGSWPNADKIIAMVRKKRSTPAPQERR